MVLYGVLEYFLHGASASWRVDYTAKGKGENGVFADAVLKELGNVGGKGRWGLMTIQPCRKAEAFVLALGVFAYHLKGR